MAQKKRPPKRKEPGPFPEPYLKKPLPYWTIPQRAGDTPLVQKFKQNRLLAMPLIPPAVLHALIVVAVARLEQLNPHAARQFEVDVANLMMNISELFGLTSASDNFGPGGPANVAKSKDDYERFLDDFFAEIEAAKVAIDKRHEPRVSSAMRRLILGHYRRLTEEIQAAQAAARPTKTVAWLSGRRFGESSTPPALRGSASRYRRHCRRPPLKCLRTKRRRPSLRPYSTNTPSRPSSRRARARASPKPASVGSTAPFVRLVANSANVSRTPGDLWRIARTRFHCALQLPHCIQGRGGATDEERSPPANGRRDVSARPYQPRHLLQAGQARRARGHSASSPRRARLLVP